MDIWPLQNQADSFYGNPRGPNGKAAALWEWRNLTTLKPPFVMHFNGTAVNAIRLHRRCVPSLRRTLAAIWQAAAKDQQAIDAWGVSTFGGSYNYRLKRNATTLSMHAYGCAIDLAPERFPMGCSQPCFCPQVLKAFSDEGWVNLAHDRMHFQAARL